MTGSTARSTELYARAEKLLPGGVSSPVRAFRHIGGAPVFMTRGEGAHVSDEDGNTYVDYCLAWGPLILGHAHPAVIAAVEKSARDGLAFGTCHRHEAMLAERVLAAYPWSERVRFVVSGTEAVQTAVRLARAHTKRKKLLKFTGCYHGHVDALMVKAGSGLVTQGIAESEGVVAVGDTVTTVLGDEAALDAAFAAHPDLAAVIVEPVPANNGLLLQTQTWHERLRALCTKHGTLLIHDEVITGFRFGYHGYGKMIGIEPDLVTLGKILGGGLPVAAVTGKAAILDRLAPLGAVYQAGTMAGNPVALAAGIATLDVLKSGEAYAKLEQLGKTLESALKGPQIARVGSVFWLYFDGVPPTTAEAIGPAQAKHYRERYRGWLEQGIYLPPSAYEVGFLSIAHTDAQVRALAAAVS